MILYIFKDGSNPVLIPPRFLHSLAYHRQLAGPTGRLQPFPPHGEDQLEVAPGAKGHLHCPLPAHHLLQSLARGSLSSYTKKPTRLTRERSDKDRARPSLLSIMAVTAPLLASARPRPFAQGCPLSNNSLSTG